MGISSSLSAGSRMGIHYFPDTLHYRETDLQTWLPELQALGISWLFMRSELGRAVPEHFLRGLKGAGIEPVIQFRLPLERLPDRREMETLLSVYARWGARCVMFFDRPNARTSWPSPSWLQQDLVERFLDRYLPAAGLAVEHGLAPVFPALEPGGSYWDTTFLRSALQAMLRRKQEHLLQKLILSAYAWTGRHTLDWGAGGPERWPESRPYQTPTGSQDQRGFRIFDWYSAIARSVLQHDLPILLLQAGQPVDPALPIKDAAGVENDPASQPATTVAIARLLAGELADDPIAPENALDPIPAQVIGCGFWLLSAGAGSPFARQAWFDEDGHCRPVVEELRKWRIGCQMNSARKASHGMDIDSYLEERPIRHYLLLPEQDGGIADWYLEIIRPFVKKHHPTVGFSVDEAEHAARVTVVGPEQNYPQDSIERLAQAGCWVEQIQGSGIDIATELAER